MCDVDPIQLYLSLSNDLFDGRILEADLPTATSQLPLLDKELLNKLAQSAEAFALNEPRRGWALMQGADAAANFQNCDLFTRSLAAWYLSRACNHWTQPQRVNKAISRARLGFEELNESGWVAACDWQLNVLSWTEADFVRSALELQQALAGLQTAGISEFIPHCRLSLAYAQMLIGKYDQARENIFSSEADFSAQGDMLNQARCWLNQASIFRRQAQFDQAFDQLDKALEVFENQNAQLDIAKTKYQLALLHLMRTDDLSIAITNFEQAIQIFSNHDLDLWQAACTTNLGSVYLQAGQLTKAEACYQEARQSFTRHGVLGLLADNLTDNGKLNIARGYPEISIEQYKQAEEIYRKLDSKLSMGLLIANLGEAYGQLGRYQDALHHLERAAEQLKSINHSLHLGTCEMYMARVWSRLEKPALAHEHLDKASACYEESKQKALLSSLYNSRARIYFDQTDTSNGIIWLKKSLEIAEKHGVRPQVALAHRLLGEALVSIGQLEEGREHLETSLLNFQEMGMLMEHAAGLVALGTYYTQRSQPAEARARLEQALQHSQRIFPEIDWRAHAALAELAENRSDHQTALASYRQAIEILNKIRHNFWQPVLAGSYLQNPAHVFASAIALAVQANAAQDALQFIEAGKAATLLQQLSTSSPLASSATSQNMNDLKAEIDWLQRQLIVSFDTPNRIKSALQSRTLRTQLIEKVKQYDTELARLERTQQTGQKASLVTDNFDLASFRKLADQALGKSWVALDYYITGNQLATLMITTDTCQLHRTSISERARMALGAVLQTQRDAIPPSQSDLRSLGDLLIPKEAVDLLTPQTYLALVPHERLHGIPWPALQPIFMSQPLVCACIPAVLPSLHSLTLLWQRQSMQQISQSHDGLLIGISKFKDAKRELPHVREEIRGLSTRLGTHGQLLVEQDATWENLIGLKNDNVQTGLSRFDWLHVASHFFLDPHTGRLSGIALSDGDVWLDQLRDLAPLPSLVTFSACNSIYSFLYKGDEHVGLPATCMIAGADSIIGSAWPVLDKSAAAFTLSFYDHYFEGLSPAQALAQTQCQLIEDGEPIENWGSFICMGVP